MQEKLLVVHIKRSKWITGVLYRLSKANTFEGGCCIGHHGLAFGIPPHRMSGCGYPRIRSGSWGSLWKTTLPPSIIENLPPWAIGDAGNQMETQYEAQYVAGKINDHWEQAGLSDTEAIDLLRPIFKFLGAKIIYYKNR